MENQDCEEASVYPCCSQSTFPYKQDVFELCIKRAIMELDRSTTYHLVSRTPGPRFDINDTIRAIVLEFQSTYLFTLAYEKMFQFYSEVGPVTCLHAASAAVCFVRLMVVAVAGGCLDHRGVATCPRRPQSRLVHQQPGVL